MCRIFPESSVSNTTTVSSKSTSEESIGIKNGLGLPSIVKSSTALCTAVFLERFKISARALA
jgi:hypothetical protein